MSQAQLQQTPKNSEALDVVRFFAKNGKKSADREAANEAPETTPTKAKEEPKPSKPAKRTSSPKTNPTETKVTPVATSPDRGPIPKEQMSGHRVGTDIPLRLDRELLYRKEQGIKATLAEITDEILNVGLEFYEKQRNKRVAKKAASE